MKSEELKKQLEELKKRYNETKKRERAEKSKKEREVDTRRKILYGAIVIKTEPGLLSTLRDRMEERDKDWIDCVEGRKKEDGNDSVEKQLIPESIKDNWRVAGISLDADLVEKMEKFKKEKGDAYEESLKAAIEITVKSAKSNRANYLRKMLSSDKTK